MMYAGGLLLLFFLLLSVAGEHIAPADPLAVHLDQRLQPPNFTQPLGTDHLGRCLFSRILCGTRYSLLSALAAVSLALVLGLPAGLLSRLGAGRLDRLIMGLCDMILAFPFLILALALTGILGPSLSSLIIGLGLASWAWWAKFVRGMVLNAWDKDFVRQGKVMGLGRLHLLWAYILPQILPPLLVTISLNTGQMIVVLSSFNYLGLGIQPPLPEWGAMLREAMLYLGTAPWLVVAPGVAVSGAVLACNLLGEGLKDYFHLRNTDNASP